MKDCKGGDSAGTSNTVLLRVEFATGKPMIREYGELVTKLNSFKLIGKGSVFKQGPRVPVTKKRYFKTHMDASLTDLG